MAKRDIGKEIIQGIEELKAWKRGEIKLKTFAVELPRAADVPAIGKELKRVRRETREALRKEP